MKSLLLCLAIFFVTQLQAQQIEMINRNWIDLLRGNSANDTLYVINFWATWCKPCVEELPIFEKLTEQTKDKKLKVLLVSNDLKRELNARLPKFIHDKNIRSQVLFMNEGNANVWIEKINKNWSGAIPATWVIKPSAQKEYFHEGEISEEQLNKLINQYNK